MVQDQDLACHAAATKISAASSSGPLGSLYDDILH